MEVSFTNPLASGSEAGNLTRPCDGDQIQQNLLDSVLAYVSLLASCVDSQRSLNVPNVRYFMKGNTHTGQYMESCANILWLSILSKHFVAEHILSKKLWPSIFSKRSNSSLFESAPVTIMMQLSIQGNEISCLKISTMRTERHEKERAAS